MSNKKQLPQLAKNIRAYRLREGLSQADLAKRIGYSQQIINAYENGQRIPPPATLELLATEFGISIDTLVGKKKTNGDQALPAASKIIKKLRVVENFPPKDQKKVLDYVDLLARANKQNEEK